MHIRQNYQREFFENCFMDFELDPDSDLIKLEKELPWDELCEVPGKYYSRNQGRPTKPSRAKIGLLILKHLYCWRAQNDKQQDKACLAPTISDFFSEN